MCIPAVKERSTLVYLIKWFCASRINERGQRCIWNSSPHPLVLVFQSRYTLLLWHPLCALAAHNCSRCPKPSMHSDVVVPLHILFILLGIPFHLLMPCRIPSHPSNSKPNGFFCEDITVSMDKKREDMRTLAILCYWKYHLKHSFILKLVASHGNYLLISFFCSIWLTLSSGCYWENSCCFFNFYFLI